MPNVLNILLIPLLPFVNFLLLGLFGKTYLKKSAGVVGTVLMLASAFLAFQTAYEYFFVYGKVGEVYQQLMPLKLTWLVFAPGMQIDMGLMIDPISVMMLIVVTFISFMVHLYSLGYMKGDGRIATYYSFLGLFTFSMLGLVLATNIFQMYIFWELVGVSSFLLIGYYYDKPSAVAACKKAFIVTRFADFGFLIGILTFAYCGGSFDIPTLISALTSPDSNELKTAIGYSFVGVSAISWGAILIFIGGAGKSAMFPLHIWLPDAMEGPTPVSALIHAATMVVAGVYLVARLFPIFSIAAPAVLEIVGWVGVISAVIAAIIACTQTDIKRVLAYSTMSQIGFMMFALGVAKYGGEAGLGFTASLFHLFTHAIFKALLFLGAGAVIHYVHSNEMKDMGGLRKNMPITHTCFLIACLAIAGVPPFAGFFSKEEILLAAFHHNRVIYYIALFTSGLTAFYMFRLYFSIFWNREHSAHDSAHQDHARHGEGGWVMMLPLVLLAIGSAVAGFVPFGHFISSDNQILELPFHLLFSIAPVLIGITGITIALIMYKTSNDLPAKWSAQLNGMYQLAYHKFYIDELYLLLTKKVIFNLIGNASAWIDQHIVNAMINAAGTITQQFSEAIKKLQSGKVQQYGIYFFTSVIIIVVVLIYVWN